MLSTARASKRALGVVTRVQTRSFFDFLAEVNRSKTGTVKVTETIKEESFTWGFLDYFKKHEPERAAEFLKDQQECSAAENYLGAKVPTAAKIDFEKWRGKIADPAFVDKLEAELKAHEDYWLKFTTYEQTREWSEAGWTEESQRDYSFKKIADNEKEILAAKVQAANEAMEKHRELIEEIKLDYQQLEAERDLFCGHQETLSFAMHPQLAEFQEETYSGKQTFHDLQMQRQQYQKYVKLERLAQAQNENRRNMFLDRYKQFSHLRGHDDSLPKKVF